MFNLLYYIGLMSCAAQGAGKSRYLRARKLYALALLISAVFNSFGGGLTRDVLIMRVHPFLLTREAIPEVLIVMVAAILSEYILDSYGNTPVINALITLTDALGVGTFVIIGADKALSFNAPLIVVCLCAWATSTCGGIIAALFCGQGIRQIISKNIAYRLATLAYSVIYTLSVSSGTDTAAAQGTCIVGLLLCILLVDNGIRHSVISRVSSAVVYFRSLATETCLLLNLMYENGVRRYKTNPTDIQKTIMKSVYMKFRIYILCQRVLQM